MLTKDHVNGIMMYNYCSNNPVMRTDSQGMNWWTDFWSGLKDSLFRTGKIIAKGFKVAGTAIVNYFRKYSKEITVGLVSGAVLIGCGVAGILTGGLAGAVILGAGIGFFSFSNASINQQSGNVSIKKAFINGAIGAVVGAASGLLSFGLGQLGSYFGHLAGNALSNMFIAGHNVSKAFSLLGGTSFLTTLGKGIGYLTASIFGGAFVNEISNNSIGINPSFQDNMQEGVNGVIVDFIINIFRKMLGR